MFNQHQYINTSITPFLQSLAPQYALLDQARTEADEARAAHNQTLSEWHDAQKARNAQKQVKAKAEMHISAILRVHAAKIPLYQNIVAMWRLLRKNKEQVKCLPDRDRSPYDKWCQSLIERNNFICAEKLLVQAIQAYRKLIEVHPAFPTELTALLESNFVNATTQLEDRLPELPANPKNDFDRAVADLMVRLVAQSSYHEKFYYFDISAEMPAVVDAAIENLNGGYWVLRRSDDGEEIEATRKKQNG